MNRAVLKQLKALQPGCLLRVDWFDASTGRAIMTGPIDIRVTSWGIFLCIYGEKNKHIILAQNNFKVSEHLYDIDYTAIPLAWTVSYSVLSSNVITEDEANKLLQSFVAGARTRVQNRAQMRAVNHGS